MLSLHSLCQSCVPCTQGATIREFASCTFVIINSSVTVFMQQLFHAAECDSSEVPRILQLQEALQVGR